MVMNTRAIDSRSKHIKRYAEKGALKAKRGEATVRVLRYGEELVFMIINVKTRSRGIGQESRTEDAGWSGVDRSGDWRWL